MDKLLKKSRDLAYAEVERTGMPLKQHVDLSYSVGTRIAEEQGANVKIVQIGTLLMDCMIGQALKENRLGDHVQMSLDKTNELLVETDIKDEDKELIRRCVLEHHGVEKFHSLESEICANADCFRFASIKGFSFALRYLRDMPFPDLVKLLRNKVEEKWGVVTISTVREELKPQYETICKILDNLEKE
jgi:hypothetical protein